MTAQLLINGTPAYPFTDSDILWSCRMLYGESGSDCHLDREGLAVMWTMINRLALLWPRFKSFTKLIRGYSQPINPAWANGGKFDSDPSTVDDRERRREYVSTMPMKKIPAGISALVDSILVSGGAPPGDMIGLVHFYAPTFYYAKKKRCRRSKLSQADVVFACNTAFGSHEPQNLVWSQPEDVDPRGNAFYAVRATVAWQPGKVRIRG